MLLNVKIVFLAIFIALTIIDASIAELCPFSQSVDLRQHRRFPNGSYNYHGIEVPLNRQEYFDYIELAFGEIIHVERHLRGCICDKWHCSKLCCRSIHSYLNTTTQKCEKIPKHVKLSKKLMLVNSTTHRKMPYIDVSKYFVWQRQSEMPCDKLLSISLAFINWELYDNGWLYLPGENYWLSTNSYCLSPFFLPGSEYTTLTPLSCSRFKPLSLRMTLNTYGMLCNIIFLLPTIIIYAVLEEKRNTLHGRIIISCLSSSIFSNTIFWFSNTLQGIYHNNDTLKFSLMPCRIMGFSIYFFCMTSVMWLTLLSYNMWRNIKNLECNQHMMPACIQSEDNTRFWHYTVYVWVLSSLFTLTVIAAEFSSLPVKYRPNIGKKYCWLDVHSWSADIWYYGPNALILAYNFQLFCRICLYIFRIRKQAAPLLRGDSKCRRNVITFIRLFVLMGVFWFLDLCTHFIHPYEIIFNILDFVTCSHGIWEFFILICNAEIFKMLQKKFLTWKKAIQRKFSFTNNNV